MAWNQVAGDYLEFGVWHGHSFATAYTHMMKERDNHMRLGYSGADYDDWKRARPRFFAFDSFAGLPDLPGAERMVDYAPGAYECSREDFERNVVRQGVLERDMVVVEGLFSDTCTSETKKRHSLSRVSMAMIDCDLYESTVPVLDFLTDLVQQGTILVFDDWFRFKGHRGSGEQRACQEWLARNPHIELVEFWRQGPQAVSFLVNLRS